MISDKRFEEIKNCRVYVDEKWITPTKKLFNNPNKFSAGFIPFDDKMGENWVDIQGNLLSDKKYQWVGCFNNEFARFTDDLGQNWVNKHGEELSNKRYLGCGDFVNHFAWFEDEDGFNWVNEHGDEVSDKRYNGNGDFIDGFAYVNHKFSGVWQKGYVNYLGFEFRNKKLIFDVFSDETTFENNKPILIKMENQLLHDFPENSLKRYILKEILC